MDLEVVREIWEMQGAVPAGAADARAQAHRAVACLAAASRALLGEAGSHLDWLAGARAFATPVIAGKVRIALAPAKLTLLLTDAAGNAGETFALAGKTSSDAAKWVAEQARKYGAEVAGETGAPVTFAASEALEDLARSFANAHRALLCVAAMTKSEQPVRIEPETLHLTVGVAFGDGNSVALGYCDGDAEIPAPYYYAKPCPRPKQTGADSLPELESGGAWKTDGAWFGGILPRAEWVWYGAEQLQAGCVVAFLDSAVDASRDLLGR